MPNAFKSMSLVFNRAKIIMLCCFITIAFLLWTPHSFGAEAEEQQWQPVPKENYAEVLELIASRSRANFDKISSWQGRMNIHETHHHYGRKAAEMANASELIGLSKSGNGSIAFASIPLNV